jgi:ATP-dependent helicase/nuclease subunit B
MDPFVEQLKRLCADHPTRAKWVFVPSHAIGHTLGDRLVLEGTGWANLRFVTPFDVALRMGAPFLVERGIDPSEEGLGPALMMRLLLSLPEPDGYFRALATQPQMALALWSTVQELRMAGVRAADVTADVCESGAKHAELRALLVAYESFLDANRRGDRATVFEEALQHQDWCPIQPADCWTELPDTVWPPMQRRLIDAMPGERNVPAWLALPQRHIPRRLADARVDRRTPDAANTLAWLSAPGAAAPASSLSSRGLSIDLFHAGGREAEIEEVFRRLLAGGASIDQAEIVCASSGYSTLIWEKAMRYEWPVTLAQGIPAALTRPGRAVLALAEWVEDDFAAGRLRRLLQSGDVRLGDDVPISTGRAARLLVRAQAAWGRDTYRRSLARLAKSSRLRAARDDIAGDEREALVKRAGEAEALSRWIEARLAAIPAPDGRDAAIDLQPLVVGACQFVDRFAARASALDALAASRLVDAIGELRALGEFRCPLAEALRFLRERVESLTVGIDRPRPGHLYVSALASAGYSGRSRVFVVGLEEGRVFPSPFEDPVLLDSERARINPALARASDRTDEAVYTALSRLAALTSCRGPNVVAGPEGPALHVNQRPALHVTLSYSCRDLREYRQTYASWVMLQACRVISGKPSAKYSDLHDHLGAPKSCVPDSPDAALGASRWWLHGVTRAGLSARQAVHAAYSGLAAGAIARAARLSAAFTEFDGHVPAAGALLDPFTGTVVVSPTQLEEAASCPFRHFLRRGLGVDAIESGDRERDVWIDPLLRGSLLHDLYAELLRRSRAASRRVTLKDDRDWLLQRGREMLDDLAREMPPASAEIRDRETELLLEDLDLFVNGEAALDASRTPIGFEVSFGRADAVDDEPLAYADPVTIDLGGGRKLRIAGRIDRIDRVGPSTYEIVDYKTGGYWPDDWKGTFESGTRLQHALYGLAARELLRRIDKQARVAGAEYYFTSAKGFTQRKRIAAPSAAALGAVLSDLRDVIASGAFIHARDDRACKFCRHGYACGQDARQRADAKIDHADAALGAYIRLGRHE